MVLNMTVFVRRKQTVGHTPKRKSSASKTTLTRRCSSTMKFKSLVPRNVTKRMVEGALALDTKKIIGAFSERKRWASTSDLSDETKTEEEKERKEEMAKLVVQNEKLNKDLETVTLKLRDVERQLIYERAFYEEQKREYVRVLRSRVRTRNVKTQTFEVDFVYESEKVSSLICELRTIRELYSKQKVTIAEVCEKYLRMRSLKEYLLQEMTKAEERNKEMMEEAMSHFDEDRVAFATVEREGKLTNELQAKLVERSSKLAYNNAALQLQLHLAASSRARANPRTLSSDLIIYSALKEIRDLSQAEKNMWKMMDNRRVWSPDIECEDEVIGKFISFPVEDAEGYKITPLFQIEDVNEEELEDGDVQEVEVEEDEGTGRTESAFEFRRSRSIMPLRSDSAPDIVLATG